MTAISDRAAVQLALECASRIVAPGTSGLDNMLVVDDMLEKAEKILQWHDKMCEKRAAQDTLRVNAPQRIVNPLVKGAKF